MTARYLQRRRDVRELAKLGEFRGHALKHARGELTAAQREESIEVAVDADAHQLACAQAAQGDKQAAAALHLADQLDQVLVDEERRIRASPRESTQPVAPGDPALFRALRVSLASHRASGLGFERAWARAIAPMPRGPQAEGVWRLVLEATRSSWRAAYELDADQPAERVAALLEGLEPDDWAERAFEQVA